MVGLEGDGVLQSVPYFDTSIETNPEFNKGIFKNLNKNTDEKIDSNYFNTDNFYFNLMQ